MRVLSAMLVVGLLLLPLAQAGDDGVTGNWKVTVFEDGNQVSYWLIALKNKGGKLDGTSESLGKVAPTTLTNIKLNGDVLEYSLELPKGAVFTFQGKLPRAGAKKIFGSLARGTMMIPAVMEATPAKNSFELERDILVRTPNDPRVFAAVMNLIAQARDKKVAPKEVQEWTETAMRTAENFGPRWQLDVAQELVDALLRISTASDAGSKKGTLEAGYAQVAVDTARKAHNLFDAKAPLETRLRMLTALGTALSQAGQKDQTKEIETRLDSLENQAYIEYQAKALDFKVARFAGRKTKSNRTVLVELFTGAQCPPCVGADLAFDAMPKAYDTKEVVLLQYHLHVPGPDALTNADDEARADYYADKIRGTPTVLFNGKVAAVGGGQREDAAEVYSEYRKTADPLLDMPASAQLQVSAARKGDKIYIKASVKDLDKPGDKVKLRLALAEDWARYKGRNGLSYYHQVVRAFPGGVAGLPLVKKDTEQNAVVDLQDLRAGLTQYLDKAAKEEPFLDSQRPMRLRKLNVVAFIQNDTTQEVLQAQQIAVREE